MPIVILASVAFLLIFLRACLRDEKVSGPRRGLLLQARDDEPAFRGPRFGATPPRSCRQGRTARRTG
jgi:hypothetical protein